MKKSFSIVGLLVLLVLLFIIGQVGSTGTDYPVNPACGPHFPVGRVPSAIAAGDFNQDTCLAFVCQAGSTTGGDRCSGSGGSSPLAVSTSTK